MTNYSYTALDTLGLIEKHRLTVTWHFNGFNTKAVCYDRKGNNRTTDVDLNAAVEKCVQCITATSRLGE